MSSSTTPLKENDVISLWRQKIENARCIPNEEKKCTALWRIAGALPEEAQKLARLGKIDIALQVCELCDKLCELYPLKPLKDRTLSHIAFGSLEGGNPDKALQITQLISSKKQRRNAFSGMVGRSLKACNFNQAIEMVERMNQSMCKDGKVVSIDGMVVNISEDLKNLGDCDRALCDRLLLLVEECISDKDNQSRAFLNISNAATQAGDPVKATQIAMRIPCEKTKGQALQNISKALTQKREYSQATEAAMLIANENQKGFALLNIARALIQNGQMDEAIKLAELISDKNYKNYVLWDISKALTQKGEYSQATKISMLISDENQKRSALQDISTALIQNGKTGEAAQVDLLIPQFVDISEEMLKKVFPFGSNFVQNVGKTSIRDVAKCLNNNNAIYSVGSGNGAVEAYLQACGFRVTCIDPDPYGFSDSACPIFLPPKYEYLADALPIAEKDNATLCLIAPPLEGSSKNDWQMEALNAHRWNQILLIIKKINPSILIKANGSGSNELWQWFFSEERSNQYETRYTNKLHDSDPFSVQCVLLELAGQNRDKRPIPCLLL